MKFFIVEGFIKNQHLFNDHIMQEHMAYSQKAMDAGLILMSGLKANMDGAAFIMKASSVEEIDNYLNNEPFKLNGLQDYKVLEFSPHYFNPDHNKWFTE